VITLATTPPRNRAATAARVAMLAWSLVMLPPLPAAAQSAPSPDALRREIEELREGQRRLEGQIEEIKKLLAGTRPPETRNVVVAVAGSPFKGEPTATVTVVEFSDYQCPFCRRYARDTFPRIEAEYVRTGKVRYVFRDFPIGSLHPRAFKAHEAGHCAGEQGKYWEMHDRLFKNQRALMVDNLRGFARDLGLKVEDFNSCLDQGKYATTVSEDLAAGSAVGVTGTPTFFIGKTAADGTIEATSVRGAQPITSFRQAIDRQLEGQKP